MVLIGCLYMACNYEPKAIEFNWQDQLFGFFLFFLVAVCEEIICRGIVYRLLCDRWNICGALIVSSAFFGLLHVFNSNATLFSALAIAITSGWMLAIAYSYHHTLWLPIGMHWAWNYLEGYVSGCPVSGETIAGTALITPSFTGSNLLTGGTFGPEASVITILLGIIVSSIYTVMYFRGHKQRLKVTII